MKKLNKIEQVDVNTVNKWIVAHGKTYVTNICDLNSQIERYNHFQMIRRLTTTLVALATVAFFGYFLLRAPEQINTDSIFGLSALVALIWCIVYILCRSQHPDKTEVFKSVRKFDHDWKTMKKLEQKGHDFDTHLFNIGYEIAEADRMLNKPEAERLKKKLRKEQKTLLAFGRCKEDWGIYIPEIKPSALTN